jgi:hypothetical protein
MPLLETPAPGDGDLPPAGSLLALAGDAQLSNVRRHDGRVEVRLWNARKDRPAEATLDGRTVVLGPARIQTIALER